MRHLIAGIFFILSFETARAEGLPAFLERVQKKNLEIQVQSQVIQGALDRSKGYKLPPPMVGISQMRNLQGESYAFEIQQQLPFPSKLSDDKKSRVAQLKLQEKESRYFTDDLLLEARLAYVSYWASFEKIKLMEELRGWLKHHLSYAQTLSRSDTEMKLHALEIESSIGIYNNEISTMKGTLENNKAKLRSLVFDSSYEPGEPELDAPEELKHKQGTTSRISELDLGRLKVLTHEFEVAKVSNLPNLFMKVRKLDRPMMGMANQEIMLGIDLPFAFFWQTRAEKSLA